MSELSNSIAKQTMEQPKDDVTEASNKTSPSLSDMPIDVVALITEKLDYKQQLILRKVSKSLRALVDSRKPGCKTIQIVFYKEHLNITFNNQCVMYRSIDYECKNNTGIVVKRDDFMKVAFDDLASTLKNPKLQLEEFVVYNESSEGYCNEIRNTLKSLNHQVSVRKVTFTKSNPPFVLAVLPYMKPGVLENISLILYKNRNNQNDEMEKIVLLEQWKQAKELELQNSFDKFPMKYATSFRRFHIGEGQIDEKKFGRIKKYLSKLDNFEHCTLSCWKFQPKLVHRLLGAPVSSTSTEEVFHHFIPNSDYYFEIKKPAQSIDMTEMSDTSTGDPEQSVMQTDNDISKVMGQLSVTSNETSTQPKNLSDMPVDVVGLIIERSEYKEQLLLRTVSKSLRALVDRVTPACKSILIVCQMENIIIILDNNDLVYTNDEYFDGCNGITVIKDKKVAFDYLAATLKNPKLKLEDFGVSYENYDFTYLDECYNEIQRVSESLNHQVKMSDTSTGDPGKPMEQSTADLSEAMGQLSVNSDETSTPPKNLLTRLKVRFESECALVYYNEKFVIYASPQAATLRFYSSIQRREYIPVVTDDFENVLFDDLASTLKNPMLQLEHVSFYFDEHYHHHSERLEHFSRLKSVLGSIDHQLSIRNCYFQIVRRSEYCSILPYLKPGVLEKIIVQYDSRGDTSIQDTPLETLNQISLLEQWKQAKELEFKFGYDHFLLKYAKHFKRIVLNEVRVMSVWLDNMADRLATLNNLEYCRIATSEKLDTQHLCSELGKPAAPNERNNYVCQYLIPNSYDYLEFMFFERMIEIERKKSNVFNKALPTPKTLSDMPVDVVSLVVERSDYKEQLILRNVSKSFRALVDEHKPALRNLLVFFTQDKIRCHFNDQQAEYSLPDGFNHGKYRNSVKIQRNDYEKIAFDDLASTLKNPKLQLENFSVKFHRYYEGNLDACILGKFKKMKDLLASIDHQISARNVEVDFVPPSAPLSVLPYVKLGVLERISVAGIDYRCELSVLMETMEQVSLLDQWKQTKELGLGHGFYYFPMKYATHFKRFFLNPYSIKNDQFDRFRDFLCALENFEYAKINNEIDHYETNVIDVYRVGPPAPRPWEKRVKYVSHHPIPDSEYYLEMKFFLNNDIKIEKKKSN
ncbi:unnamed protein product [Caenorhabditis brenneri]